MCFELIIYPIDEIYKKEVIFEIKKILNPLNIKYKLNNIKGIKIKLKDLKNFKVSFENIYLKSYFIKRIDLKLNKNNITILKNKKDLNFNSNNEITLFELEKEEFNFKKLKLISKYIELKLFKKIQNEKILYLNYKKYLPNLWIIIFFNNFADFERYKNRFRINYFKYFGFDNKFESINNKKIIISNIDNEKFKDLKEFLSKKNIKFTLNKANIDFLDLKNEENEFDVCHFCFFSNNILLLDKILYQLEYITKREVFILNNYEINKEELLLKYFKKFKKINIDSDLFLYIFKN